jgi:hypothetical protein
LLPERQNHYSYTDEYPCRRKNENPTSCLCAFMANKSSAFQAGWELPIHPAE